VVGISDRAVELCEFIGCAITTLAIASISSLVAWSFCAHDGCFSAAAMPREVARSIEAQRRRSLTALSRQDASAPGGHESHEFLLTTSRCRSFRCPDAHQDHLAGPSGAGMSSMCSVRAPTMAVRGGAPSTGRRRWKKVNRRDAQSSCYVNVRGSLVDVLRRTDLDEVPCSRIRCGWP